MQWSVHTLKIFLRVKRGDFEMGKLFTCFLAYKPCCFFTVDRPDTNYSPEVSKKRRGQLVSSLGN